MTFLFEMCWEPTCWARWGAGWVRDEGVRIIGVVLDLGPQCVRVEWA